MFIAQASPRAQVFLEINLRKSSTKPNVVIFPLVSYEPKKRFRFPTICNNRGRLLEEIRVPNKKTGFDKERK